MEKTTKEKYTVAVVEDEEDMSRSLAEELGDAGFEVVTAQDGERGFAMVLGEKPDLILLDIVMPKMDGMTMMSKLRRSGEYGKHVPIILLTNLNADNHIMEGITKDEPSYYLVKSNYTLADVVQKVENSLKLTV